jgi:hypothetical protein
MGRGAKGRASIIAGGVTLLVLTAAASPAAADINAGTVGGLTYIFDQSAPFTGPNGDHADAACPPGTRVVGGGAEIGGPLAFNHLNTSFPFDGADGDRRPDDIWIAHAWLGVPFSDTVVAIAVCWQGKARYRTSSGMVQPGTARTLRATCLPGTHVSGGGVFVTGGIGDSRVTSSWPYDGRDAASAPDDGWAARVYNVGAFGPKRMTVYAICLTVRPRYVAAAPVTVDNGSLPMTGPACPASRHLTAGGIRLVAPLAAEARPVTILPFDLADADSVPDDALRADAGTTSVAETATMFRYAICR